MNLMFLNNILQAFEHSECFLVILQLCRITLADILCDLFYSWFDCCVNHQYVCVYLCVFSH